MALYRKYRPNTFADVIGQDHITTTIANQIKTGTLSHAYLFCGTRGTGKTTIARILARAINCEGDCEIKPCNTCLNCTDILKNYSPNVIEIDAASNNGVDNIRDILEEVKYPPVTGKYKIYIIDEVHMLSLGAFNALLKTLEEPPSHVIFMLATTDPHKVPATIHSRCQRYEFRRIPTGDLASNIENILKAEGVSAEQEAIWIIATLGDGSARDSLSILGQTLAFYSGQTITAQNVRDMLGMVDTTVLFDITGAIVNRDILAAVQIVYDLSQSGRDFYQFANELLSHMRNLALSKLLKSPSHVLDIEQSIFDKLMEQSQVISSHMLQIYIDQLSDLIFKLKTEKNPKLLLEVAMIKLASLVENGSETPVSYVSTQKKQVDNQNIQQPISKKEVPTQSKKKQSEKIQDSQEPLVSIEGFDRQKFIAKQPILIKTILASCKFSKEYDTICIRTDEANLILLKPKYEELQKSLKELFGDHLSLEIVNKENQEKKTEIENKNLTVDQQQEIQNKINMNIIFN